MSNEWLVSTGAFAKACYAREALMEGHIYYRRENAKKRQRMSEDEEWQRDFESLWRLCARGVFVDGEWRFDV